MADEALLEEEKQGKASTLKLKESLSSEEVDTHPHLPIEQEKEEFSIFRIFAAANIHAKLQKEKHQMIDKRDALIEALHDVIIHNKPPFVAREAEWKENEYLALPIESINKRALFEFVSSRSGIPQEEPFPDPFHPGRENPAYTAFQERKRRHQEHLQNVSPDTPNTLAFEAALDLLELAWDYHEQYRKDLLARKEEMPKDAPLIRSWIKN